MTRHAHRIRDSSKNPRQIWRGFSHALADLAGAALRSERGPVGSRAARRCCAPGAVSGPPGARISGHRCPSRRGQKQETAVNALFRPSGAFYPRPAITTIPNPEKRHGGPFLPVSVCLPVISSARRARSGTRSPPADDPTPPRRASAAAADLGTTAPAHRPRQRGHRWPPGAAPLGTGRRSWANPVDIILLRVTSENRPVFGPLAGAGPGPGSAAHRPP